MKKRAHGRQVPAPSSHYWWSRRMKRRVERTKTRLSTGWRDEVLALWAAPITLNAFPIEITSMLMPVPWPDPTRVYVHPLPPKNGKTLAQIVSCAAAGREALLSAIGMQALKTQIKGHRQGRWHIPRPTTVVHVHPLQPGIYGADAGGMERTGG